MTVVPTSAPTANATPTITPLPPLSYQSIPGVSTVRAAAIVSRCSAYLSSSESAHDPGKVTLEDWVENRNGSTAIIDASLRVDVKPLVGLGPTAHTLLFICQMGPNDTVKGTGYGVLTHQNHAIPGPLLVDGFYSSGTERSGLSDTPYLAGIYGRVARDVAHVVWDTPDGQHVSAEIRNGYFLVNATSSGGTGHEDLHAYDQAGHELTITNSLTYPATSGTLATTYWP